MSENCRGPVVDASERWDQEKPEEAISVTCEDAHGPMVKALLRALELGRYIAQDSRRPDRPTY